MSEDSYTYKFSGLGRLYGEKALSQLKQSHVAIVGLGGVGSWVVESLARSGVGQLTLMDFDDVCMSNFNRQLHGLEGQVGRMKTQVMAGRVLAINPQAQVNCIEDMYSSDNAQELFVDKPHMVVDAIDSVSAKCVLLATAKKLQCPVVTVGGAGGLQDPTKVAVSDLSKSYADPLLKQVRKKLRREYGFPRYKGKSFKIPCVYSTELPVFPDENGGVCQQKPDGSLPLDCASGLGTASYVTGTFGLVATSVVVGELVNTSNSL